MEIPIKEAGNNIIITAPGPHFDSELAQQMDREFLRIWSGGNARGKHIILNLERIQIISSRALGILVSANRRAGEEGASLILCHLAATVSDVLRISRLNQILKTAGNLKEAIQE